MDSQRLEICFSLRSGGIPDISVTPDCLNTLRTSFDTRETPVRQPGGQPCNTLQLKSLHMQMGFVGRAGKGRGYRGVISPIKDFRDR